MVSEAHGPSATPRHTILLVDDSDDTLRLMSRLLQMHGYNVRTARTAAEAQAAVAAPVLADLIVSDLGLPDGHGADLMRDVRNRHNLRGIAVTGHSDEAVVNDCKAAGFDRYFVKPIHFDDLRAAISEMLRRPR